MGKMDQSAGQSRAHPDERPWWQFKPGQSGNPLGPTAVREAKLRAALIKLARPFGGLGKLGALDRVRLEQAAQLLIRRPTNAEHSVRISNAIDRLIGSVERSRLAAKPQRRQSTRAHLAPSELPRSLAKLVKPKP
jgi:hypothetical protein